MAFVDLCRLCGTDTLNIVRNAIFEGEGRAKKYALKISQCLALQVWRANAYCYSQITHYSLHLNVLLALGLLFKASLS